MNLTSVFHIYAHTYIHTWTYTHTRKLCPNKNQGRNLRQLCTGPPVCLTISLTAFQPVSLGLFKLFS